MGSVFNVHFRTPVLRAFPRSTVFSAFQAGREQQATHDFWGSRPDFIEQREPAEVSLCDKFRIYNPKKQI
jgi:hypothetical protein